MISASQIYIDSVNAEYIDIVEPPSNLPLTDQKLLSISAREVGQMAADLPTEQVKALKQRRRTLKNREYAAICRNKRSLRRDELRDNCSHLKQKVDEIEKQNELLKLTRRKVDEVMDQLNLQFDPDT